MRRPCEEVQLTLHESGTARGLSWADVGRLPWDDFGLVCGAGGATGMCFEAGMLLALGVDHGVCLSDASSVVGTSAGSIAGRLIALGFESHELAALIADAHAEIAPARRALGARFSLDVPATPSLFTMLRLFDPAPWIGVIQALVRGNIRVAALRSFKRGSFDLRRHLAFLTGVDWTDLTTALTICAASNVTGERIEFSAHAPIPLIDAVAASCAVPAVFAPVEGENDVFVDGGIASPTNADLLAGEGDAAFVVVLSPMTSPAARSLAGGLASRHARNQLERELRTFSKDQRVLVIEPAGDLGRRVLDDPLVTEGHVDIVRTSFLAASLACR